MSEILISLSLLLIITVSDLRLMTFYFQTNKTNYYRTLMAIQILSEAELKWMLNSSTSNGTHLPHTEPEVFRMISFMSAY